MGKHVNVTWAIEKHDLPSCYHQWGEHSFDQLSPLIKTEKQFCFFCGRVLLLLVICLFSKCSGCWEHGSVHSGQRPHKTQGHNIQHDWIILCQIINVIIYCFGGFFSIITSTIYDSSCYFQVVSPPSGLFWRRSSVMRTLSFGWPARSTKKSRAARKWCRRLIRSSKSSLMFKPLERCVCVTWLYWKDDIW